MGILVTGGGGRDSGSNVYSYAITLASSGWVGSSYTISNIQFTSSQDGVLGLGVVTESQKNAFNEADVYISQQGANNLVLQANGVVPSIDIPMQLMVFDEAKIVYDLSNGSLQVG